MFGTGNVAVEADAVMTKTLDSLRKRVYIAPMGLWLTFKMGTFDGMGIHPANKMIRIGLSTAKPYAPGARLRVEQPARIEGLATFAPAGNLATLHDAFEAPLGSGRTSIDMH